MDDNRIVFIFTQEETMIYFDTEYDRVLLIGVCLFMVLLVVILAIIEPE